MTRTIDIAIIGAGPYGLSMGAYLAAKGADFQIFGPPMEVWRTHMPRGMYLKSEGFASNLFDPKGTETLKAFCDASAHEYKDIGLPVPRDVFHDYGLAFQQKLLPDLDTRLVADVSSHERGFLLTLEDGEMVQARRVVVATGISHYAHVPPELAGLPAELVSHTSGSRVFEAYAGCKVTVIGAGSSAVDTAGLLNQAGADTQIITRRPKIWFNNPPEELSRAKSAMSRITRPRSGLGLGWRSRMACDLPAMFHRMPEDFRLRVTRGHLGPSASWASRQLVEDKVEMRHNMVLRHAEARSNRVHLTFENGKGETENVVTDHVIAATGYKVDLERLGFLNAGLRERMATVQKSPVLSRNFESSVRGIYFVGPSAANSFGPLLRFAWGAKFAAPRMAAHLTKRPVH